MRRAFLLLFALVACKGKGQEMPVENAAPSGSVISIAVGMAYCDDPPFCEKECNGGNADSCRRLGVAYELGKGGVDKDEAKAIALYDRACTMQNAMGCMSAGHLYEYGRGAKKDEARAATLYKRSCEMKYPAGCYNYALLVEEGRGVPKDDLEAARYYDMACAAGAKQACQKAESLRRNAAGAPVILGDAGRD